MAQFASELDEGTRAFVEGQRVFFVATAPPEGRINLSPKGMDTFRVLDPHTVAYLDLTGSGNETAAHIAHDGRMTMMFCGFEKKADIVRLYGRGEVVRPQDDAFAALEEHFEAQEGARQIILLHVESVQSSCGYAVPLFDYRGERPTLTKWARRKGEEGLAKYRARKNATSIDGLPVELPEPVRD